MCYKPSQILQPPKFSKPVTFYTTQRNLLPILYPPHFNKRGSPKKKKKLNDRFAPQTNFIERPRWAEGNLPKKWIEISKQQRAWIIKRDRAIGHTQRDNETTFSFYRTHDIDTGFCRGRKPRISNKLWRLRLRENYQPLYLTVWHFFLFYIFPIWQRGLGYADLIFECPLWHRIDCGENRLIKNRKS